ncbi:MAG: polyisoprenoid-binding protein [Chloroflexi bacterium]|nr:polyisoprenoid-binding protein [Chloroflexota bacterium]
MVTTANAPAKWNLDPAHSSVEFSIKHMMVSTIRGRFSKFTADINFDEAHPERSSVEAWIDLASIDTREAQRDNHLRSPDFFDVATYPTMRFKSRSVQPKGNGQYKITGDLTIRGVSREVVLDASYAGAGKDPWGGYRAAGSLEGVISRKEFGLTWNVALEAGGVLVGDNVKIAVDAELVKQAG